MFNISSPKTNMTRQVKYVFYDRTVCAKPHSCFSEGVKSVVFAPSKAAAIKKLPDWDEETHGLMAYRKCTRDEQAAADRSPTIS
jgi:hypothetical protein